MPEVFPLQVLPEQDPIATHRTITVYAAIENTNRVYKVHFYYEMGKWIMAGTLLTAFITNWWYIDPANPPEHLSPLYGGKG